MPLYEYVCPECDALWEERRSIAAADDPAICPVCKSDAERQISRFLYDRGDQLDVLPSVPNFATGSRAHARGCACCVPFRR